MHQIEIRVLRAGRQIGGDAAQEQNQLGRGLDGVWVPCGARLECTEWLVKWQR